MSGWNHVKFYYFKQLLSSFEAEMIILPLATEAEMKNGVAYTKNNMNLMKTYWCLCFESCKWKTLTLEADSFLYLLYFVLFPVHIWAKFWYPILGIGFPIQESLVQNHQVAPRLFELFILPRLIILPGPTGELMVKSKLSHCSGFVVLRQLNPFH